MVTIKGSSFYTVFLCPSVTKMSHNFQASGYFKSWYVFPFPNCSNQVQAIFWMEMSECRDSEFKASFSKVLKNADYQWKTKQLFLSQQRKTP